MDAPKARQYYIDWIRVLSFLLLILFHSAMPFVDYNWEVKNAEKSASLLSLIWWLHQWRLPLLFFISGVGIHFSLQRRSVPVFLWERTKRLLIPLLFAMFFTIPIQVYIEFLQKGRIQAGYLNFYPSVWKMVPYPEGSLTWSHLWFVVYLFTFILLLTPLFGLFKIPALLKFRKRMAVYLSHPVVTVSLVFPLMFIFCRFYLEYPEQGSLLDDWFVFLFSITLLLYGYFLGGSHRFWENCEKYRYAYGLVALACIIVLFVVYWWPPVSVPKAHGYVFNLYFVLNSMEIWMIILAACGFARKYLNFSSPLLEYLNRAVYPLYIIHQTIIVYIGYYVVQWPLPLFVKLVLLAALSCIFIFGIYHFIIRKTKITRFLFGVKG